MENKEDVVEKAAEFLKEAGTQNTENIPVKTEAEKKRDFFRVIFTYAFFITMGVVLYGICQIKFHPYMISGNSMYPTFRTNQIVACTTDLNIKRNDVVVFQGPESHDLLIKRVIGLPGEEIGINESGKFIINGIELEEEYPLPEDKGILKDDSIVLADDEYFCVGDNRNNSRDSRMFGAVNIKSIKYKYDRILFGGK